MDYLLRRKHSNRMHRGKLRAVSRWHELRKLRISCLKINFILENEKAVLTTNVNSAKCSSDPSGFAFLNYRG
jgi:hypothetical protein